MQNQETVLVRRSDGKKEGLISGCPLRLTAIFQEEALDVRKEGLISKYPSRLIAIGQEETLNALVCQEGELDIKISISAYSDTPRRALDALTCQEGELEIMLSAFAMTRIFHKEVSGLPKT